MQGPNKVDYSAMEDFWPFYLEEHSHPVNRRLHIIGTTISVFWVLGCIITGRWRAIPLALIPGYAFAWVGHFRFQKNKPATFKYPSQSLASDIVMWSHAVRGTLDQELNRFGIEHVPDDAAPGAEREHEAP